MTATAVTPQTPVAVPQLIAPDTWLIPNLVPAEPGTYVFVNSMVILAEEPIIVDTGAPGTGEQWLAAVRQWSTSPTSAGCSCPTTTATTSAT